MTYTSPGKGEGWWAKQGGSKGGEGNGGNMGRLAGLKDLSVSSKAEARDFP